MHDATAKILLLLDYGVLGVFAAAVFLVVLIGAFRLVQFLLDL